ncbi:MAG TPA: SpaA isopeptide-forming pilin-related protein [Ornithinicoccus sp.]|nr:SpaA isopeptide-forming pilin-related protein [Ornithinicoccus sp.]
MRRGIIGLASAALVAMAAWAPMAYATHYQQSLDGNGLQPASQFQIDNDANLTVEADVDAPFDWANVDQNVGTDLPTGQKDNSYKGGVKEDTECPAETTGSIPNNKSDLLQFGTWVEEGSPGYLHMYWARVTNPSGTTLMDFEFNQSSTPCGTGPNVQRTDGDLLIEYSITQGGATADMTLRKWQADAGAWGPADPITDDGQAAGTINTTAIDQMDELTQDQSPRTFGEASVDLNLIFDGESCKSFGSAMLKSRSSDSFTSQLKDFISPEPLELTNCGKVEISKVTDPTGAAQLFDYTKTFGTDPASDNTFQLADGDTETFSNVLFGTGYTVTEDDLPAGWQFSNLDCSASTGEVNYTENQLTRTVTFDIQDANDYLKCTYYNEALADLTIVKQVNDEPGADDFDFSSTGGLSPATFTLTPTGTDAAGEDSTGTAYHGIATGSYTVDETVPTGWNLVSATCDNGDDPTTSIDLEAGDDVTCTFVNERERGAIEITKTRKHQAAEGGTDVHADVDFTVTSTDFPGVNVQVTTDEFGKACVPGLLYGDYTVTETVPTGYEAVDDEQDVTVSVEADCDDNLAAAADVSFENIPLTDITVSVDSQIDGGTASMIVCVDADDMTVTPDNTGGTNGDSSATFEDLLPTDPDATLVCTITVDP